MSASAPSDLAVAFRSLPRRLREASSSDDVTPAEITTATNAVEAAIASAATLLSCSPNADGVAAAIQSRKAREWTAADLAGIQQAANAAAAAIRGLQAS